MRAPLGQGLQRLLVADKGLKRIRHPLQKRVGPARVSECTIRGSHRFAITSLADITIQVFSKDTNTITAPKKRKITRRDGRHQGQNLRFDPCFDLGFIFGIITDTARPATHDHTRQIIQ